MVHDVGVPDGLPDGLSHLGVGQRPASVHLKSIRVALEVAHAEPAAGTTAPAAAAADVRCELSEEALL